MLKPKISGYLSLDQNHPPISLKPHPPWGKLQGALPKLDSFGPSSVTPHPWGGPSRMSGGWLSLLPTLPWGGVHPGCPETGRFCPNRAPSPYARCKPSPTPNTGARLVPHRPAALSTPPQQRVEDAEAADAPRQPQQRGAPPPARGPPEGKTAKGSSVD